SGLLVAVPVTVVWIIGWRRYGWRSALRGAMLGSAGFLLVAGFWYARLRWLYGEWLPMSTIQPLLPGLVRAAPLEPTSTDFWDRVDWLRYSYWGVFGYGVLAPGAYYAWVHWLMGTAAAGLLVLTIRWLLRPRTAQWLALLLALTWSGAVFIFLLNWIRTMNFSDQGRLLFPAAAAFGLLLVLGWGAFVPTRWQRWLNATVIVVFAGLATSQLSTLAAAYALPEPLPGDVAYDRPFGVEFAPGMQLLGIDLPEGATAQPGVPLPLTLYFTTNRPIDGHYTLFLHLAGNGDRLLYQFDGVPVQGRHPTRQWRPGQIFADRYTISVPQIETDTMAHLSLGFYPVDDPTQRQTVYAPAGNLIGDRIELAQVRLASEPPAGLLASGSPLAVWSNGIQLEAAQLLTDAQGRPAGVDLVWGTDAAVHEDYTVFVQVQDAQNRVLAQMDAWPRQGRWPTSTWRAGERVEDTLHWTGDTTNWARVIAGLYDREQRRLPVSAPAHAEQIVEIAAR
ncbi:MAG: hypothetical protein H3C34_22300, partial [Caldilineaceae bacterium]|nr:hypothetical protein [Caldilineaceae bacterium]